MIGKGIFPLPFIFANDNYTLSRQAAAGKAVNHAANLQVSRLINLRNCQIPFYVLVQLCPTLKFFLRNQHFRDRAAAKP